MYSSVSPVCAHFDCVKLEVSWAKCSVAALCCTLTQLQYIRVATWMLPNSNVVTERPKCSSDEIKWAVGEWHYKLICSMRFIFLQSKRCQQCNVRFKIAFFKNCTWSQNESLGYKGTVSSLRLSSCFHQGGFSCPDKHCSWHSYINVLLHFMEILWQPLLILSKCQSNFMPLRIFRVMLTWVREIQNE